MVAEQYSPPWFSIAPMMEWTDNHYRTIARHISKHAWLYTEMIAAETIVYQESNLDRFLEFSPEQHPIVLQIGGNNLENLAKATQLARSYGYDEINFNCGCPSPKVAGQGCFGVRLMLDPEDRFLEFSPEQHPIVLQIGGNNLENLAKATQLARSYGYDEINFNCGCPSPKVAGQGCFGVRLMLDPEFVAKAMTVIAANSDCPVSVKCRIGVDGHDSYNELCNFIYKVSSQSPTRHFVIHSRKALLNGISPSDNRKIPPLKYEYYYALLRDFPDLRFTINGGINSLDEVHAAQREGAHGVMVGRAAYYTPWSILGRVDSAIYGAPRSNLSRRQVLEQYQVYGDSVMGKYGNGRPGLRDMMKPLMTLFHSEPGNTQFKRKADAAYKHCKTLKAILDECLVVIPDFVLDKPLSALPPTNIAHHIDTFANSKKILPPPCTRRGEEEEEQEEPGAVCLV